MMFPALFGSKLAEWAFFMVVFGFCLAIITIQHFRVKALRLEVQQQELNSRQAVAANKELDKAITECNARVLALKTEADRREKALQAEAQNRLDAARKASDRVRDAPLGPDAMNEFMEGLFYDHK